MPLYLFALRNIEPIANYQLQKGRIKANEEVGDNYTFVKKEKCQKYLSITELDIPYSYSERKIFRLTDTWDEYLNWDKSIQYKLTYEDIFVKNIHLFSDLTLMDHLGTIFKNDCERLSFELKDWDAFVEAKTKSESKIYEIFLTLQKALDFAKDNGALWYFICDEENIEHYIDLKKSIQFHQL